MKKDLELELEIDSQVLENARKFAGLNGTTFEKLAEDFLKEFVETNRKG